MPSRAAELLGDLPQPRNLRDEWIVVEEQPVARPQHIAMQRGLMEVQRIDGTQPPLMLRGVRRSAAQQQVGQDQQQTEDDEHHSARRAGHGVDPARSDKGRPPYSPVSVRRKPAISSISCPVSTLPSWLLAISSIACSRVSARPSWK